MEYDVIRDIKPVSPTTQLRRDYSDAELKQEIDAEAACAVVGINRAFLARALELSPGSRPRKISLEQLLVLLDIDGYQETFVPRSQVPAYLLTSPEPDDVEEIKIPTEALSPAFHAGNTRDLLKRLPPNSIQCAVTSSPYWGMRVYDNDRDLLWADGESCPYGFEQTPEGFIRHTVEILYVLKPAMALAGSVWWNMMDTYNTRTPIRGSSKEKLRAMGGDPDYTLGWTEHLAVRHSAGHMYLNDGELSSIPTRVAERAARIGYTLKSFITWNKDSTPEPVKSRVTRQAEYVLHLSVGRTPYFDKAAWTNLARRLGGSTATESSEKVTDVWSLVTAAGRNGHGAEFPLALPGRCIALSTKDGDTVLDPFVGSGTSVLAAMQLGRRSVGFDISEKYIDIAEQRAAALHDEISATIPFPIISSSD